MTFLLSMPGGSEWILIILVLPVFFIVFPVLTVVFYTRSRELKKQVLSLTEEKNEMLANIMNRK